MANPPGPSELFVDAAGNEIRDGDLVRSTEGSAIIRVRYGKVGDADVIVFTTPRLFVREGEDENHQWKLTRRSFLHSAWRRVGVSGRRADVIITDGLELAGFDDSTLVFKPSPVYLHPQLVYTPPFQPPAAGSKGYQRRKAQRWPKGR